MDKDQCAESLYDSTTIAFTVTLFTYSSAVFALYSLLQRRTKLFQECCFGGYCGLPLPINLISETKDRWVYCAAFGMLVNLFALVVTRVGGAGDGVSGVLLSAIILFLTMIILPLYFFALIASIHGPLEPLSHLIGFIYTAVSFAAYMRQCAICMHYADREPRGLEFLGSASALTIVACVPQLICNGIVLMYFAIIGVYTFILRLLKKPLPSHHCVDHYLGHVRRLLNNSHQNKPAITNCIIAKLQWYKWDPYFKYSVRFLSVFVVIFIILFVWSLQTAFSVDYSLDQLKYFLINNLEVKWTDVYEAIYKVFLVIGFVVPVMSFALIVIPLIVSLTTYRYNCKQLWKGDRSFISRSKKRSPAILLTNSAFLFGRQLAMAVWAWIFYTVILFAVLLALALLIIAVVLFDAIRSSVLHYIYVGIFTIGLSILIYFGQLLFVYFIFADRSVLVNNRRLFHLYTFFFLLYNSVSGLVTTLRRTATSVVVALFFLPRLDQPLVIGGLEFLDKGYMSYLAYIQVEAAFTNPVMNVFIYLLSEQAKANLQSKLNIFGTSSFSGIVNDTSAQNYEIKSVDDSLGSNNAARRRWYLAYTLLRNPQLILLRKGHIQCAEVTGVANKTAMCEDDSKDYQSA